MRSTGVERRAGGGVLRRRRNGKGGGEREDQKAAGEVHGWKSWLGGLGDRQERRSTSQGGGKKRLLDSNRTRCSNADACFATPPDTGFHSRDWPPWFCNSSPRRDWKAETTVAQAYRPALPFPFARDP
jgi:hypothetical protein